MRCAGVLYSDSVSQAKSTFCRTRAKRLGETERNLGDRVNTINAYRLRASIKWATEEKSIQLLVLLLS